MKARYKSILMSLLALVVGVSLITGATLALFAKESKYNITISAAKVDVPSTLTLVETNEYEGEPQTHNATEGTFNFDEKGQRSVVLDGTNVELINMVLGDSVTFNVHIENKSSIDVAYRVGIMADDKDNALVEFLDINLQDNIGIIDNMNVASTDWYYPEASATADYSIVISLPADGSVTYDDINGKSCKLTIVVEAVQENAIPQYGDGVFVGIDGTLYAKVGEELVEVQPHESGVKGLYIDTEGNAYVSEYAGFRAVITSSLDVAHTNAKLTLLQDIYYIAVGSGNSNYLFMENSILDLNGHTLTINKNNAFMIVGNNNVIKNGAIKASNDSIAYPIAATAGSQNVVFEDITIYGGIQVLGNSTVKLINVTSTATNYYNVYLAGGNATVTIESGTFNVGKGANHFYIEDVGCKAILNGGTFDGGEPTICPLSQGQLINNI